MSDKTHTPVLDRPEDTARYQPLSLLAVAAILAAGLLTIVVALLTAAGLYSRKPVLEPVLILLAVGGVILALAARWHISYSEGTRAGTGLAKVALWMSLICGLCYGAYFGGNLLAIRKQASDNAARHWFEPLKEGKIDEAYFYTIDPVMRKNSSPRDMMARAGENVQKLRQQELILALDRARQEAIIEPRGVRNWSRETAGYVVSLNYLVTTREGEYDVVLTLIGSDSKELQGREWYVAKSRDMVQSRRLTTYGRMLIELQIDADRFLHEWVMAKQAPGREAEKYLDTLPLSAAQRRQKLLDDYLRIAMERIFIGGAQTSCGLSQAVSIMEFFGNYPVDQPYFFPGEAVLANKIIKAEDPKNSLAPELKEQIIPRLLIPGIMSLPRNTGEVEIPTMVEFTADEIRISIGLWFQLPPPLLYQFKGRVVASTNDPVIMKRVQEMRSAPWPAPVTEDKSPSVLAGYQPNWRISEVQVDLTPGYDSRMERFMGRQQGPPEGAGGPTPP